MSSYILEPIKGAINFVRGLFNKKSLADSGIADELPPHQSNVPLISVRQEGENFMSTGTPILTVEGIDDPLLASAILTAWQTGGEVIVNKKEPKGP